MAPQLKSGKARTAQARDIGGQDSGVYRGIFNRVFRPVFITGQIKAGFVAEGIGSLNQGKGRCQQFFQGLAVQPQVATVFAAQPQPQVVLGAWVVYRCGQLRERTQAFDAATQCLHQRRAETCHRTAAIHLLLQYIKYPRQSGRCMQGEKQVTALSGNGGGENAWLELHWVSDP
ncbi:hypothetical protein D3C77_492040 [compost metagenome]